MQDQRQVQQLMPWGQTSGVALDQTAPWAAENATGEARPGGWQQGGDDGQAYALWRQRREEEMEKERKAAAQEVRWQAKEARAGKPRLWLPEEAVRMGHNGPELKEKEEVVGRISADWGGILCGGNMTAAEITQCTLDLSDETACRMHCVAWRAPAAAAATRYDCVVALVGHRRDDLQEVLCPVAFLAMADQDIADLDATLRQWAAQRGKQWTARAEPNLRGHGQHVTEAEEARRAEEKKVETLVAMLREMGVSEETVREKLEKGGGEQQPTAWQQTDNSGDVPMPQAASEVLVIEDVDGDEEMSETMGTEIQDPQEQASATMAWEPPEASQGTEDSYLGAPDAVHREDANDDGEESIRPMTHQEIMNTWGGQVKEVRTWRKGLGKECDKTGSWTNQRIVDSEATTQPPAGTGENNNPQPSRGEQAEVPGGPMRRPGMGMQKPRQQESIMGRRYETRAQNAKRRRTQGPLGGGCCK